jgi:hypothetical protein
MTAQSVDLDHDLGVVGDPLRLRRPDGSELRTAIGGPEMLLTSVPRKAVPVLLREVDKKDVPIGTEVWSVDRA